MDDISRQMGWNVLAMDATANWDGLVGSDKVYNSAIVVYPQSTPSPYEDTSRRMVSSAQGGDHVGVCLESINMLAQSHDPVLLVH
jgi:hypothetical protein